MLQALQLQVGERYSIMSLMFFVPYIIFVSLDGPCFGYTADACQELPSNIVLRKIGARNWLAFIVTGFGVVMIGSAFVKRWWELVICRVLLGTLESES
jgi:MFS family permease